MVSKAAEDPYIVARRFISQISGLALGSVGIYLIFANHFKQHPFPMIGLACILQGVFYGYYYHIFSICQIRMNDWFAWSSGLAYYYERQGKTYSPENSFRLFQAQIYVWKFTVVSTTYLYFAANSIIFIDLYLTLKNPFYPRTKRVIYYYLFLLVVFVVSTFLLIKSFLVDGTSINLYDKTRQDQVIRLQLIFTVALVLATFIPTVLVTLKLCRKGTSKNLRQKVIRRHLIFFSIYLISTVMIIDDQTGFIKYLLIDSKGFFDSQGYPNYEYMKANEERYQRLEVIEQFIDIGFASLGIVLALIRLSEPYVYRHFKQDTMFLLKSCSKNKKKIRKQKFSNEPLCAFANSAMNIEFVYLILLGINNFMEQKHLQINRNQSIDSNFTKLKIEKLDKSTRITFCDIKVNDIDKWNVDQSDAGSFHQDFEPHFGQIDRESQFEIISRVEIKEADAATRINKSQSHYTSSSNFTSRKSNISPVNRLSIAIGHERLNTEENERTSQTFNSLKKQKQINKDFQIMVDNKSSILAQGSNIKLEATFQSYCDDQFAMLMELDNISPKDMMTSLSVEANRNMVFQAGEGAGKSGSFFFFSHDSRFLIKTLKGNEKSIFLNMLDDYIAHIIKYDNKSLLARIYGVFTIKTNYFDPLDIIIMQNTSMLQSNEHPKMIFDLKGSTAGRYTPCAPKFWHKNLNHSKCLKDLNFQEINNDISLMRLKSSQFEQLRTILEADSIFLKNHLLMDYSLLVVIEYLSRTQNSVLKNDSKASSVVGSEKISINSEEFSFYDKPRNMFYSNKIIYHIGVIDFLQDWSFQKKFENLWKGGKKNKYISAVHPDWYQERFFDYVEKNLLVRVSKIKKELTRNEFISRMRSDLTCE